MKTFIQFRKMTDDLKQTMVDYEFNEGNNSVRKLSYAPYKSEKISKEQALAEIKREIQEAGK